MEEETLEKQKSKTISLYMPSQAIANIDRECLVLGVNRSQFILSLFENRFGYSPGLPEERIEIIETRIARLEKIIERKNPSKTCSLNGRNNNE